MNLQFALETLIPSINVAYSLSRTETPLLPLGWTQTATITLDPSVIEQQEMHNLTALAIAENCIWGVVLRNGDTSVIAIRGTETWEQWVDDFEALAVASGDYWIEAGFREVWSGISASFAKAWQVASEAKYVWITGHSLGAALALIAGVHHPEAQCVPIACPRTFSPIRGLPDANNVIRIVNSNDIVCDVPEPPLFMHVGAEIKFRGTPSRFNFKAQHSLETYSAGLRGLLAKAA